MKHLQKKQGVGVAKEPRRNNKILGLRLHSRLPSLGFANVDNNINKSQNWLLCRICWNMPKWLHVHIRVAFLMKQILHQMCMAEVAGIIEQRHIRFAVKANHSALGMWPMETGFTLHQQPAKSQGNSHWANLSHVNVTSMSLYNTCPIHIPTSFPMDGILRVYSPHSSQYAGWKGRYQDWKPWAGNMTPTPKI